MLAAHGIASATGVLEPLARHVHGGFLCRIAHGRPRFTGKWAMTLDGSIATATGDSGWISAPEALALSRRRRRAFDAILVGAGTARRDDPQLLCSAPRRHRWHVAGSEQSAAGPLRIVLGVPPLPSRLHATLDQAPLLILHAPDADLGAWRDVPRTTHRVVAGIDDVARTLGDLGLNDVLVEGGPTVHGAFLRAGLYDRLELYAGALTIGGGTAVARGGVDAIADATRWRPETAPRLLGSTAWLRYARPVVGSPVT
jgi:diaminohydroxyphosphoribosylaminopyrimidine deaminase/5-amino-6-(5-phosphoribosylamino)uracil reductase